MDNGNKRFTYLEGYKGAFFIGTIVLFFYNLTGGADELMKSMSSANFLMLLLFIMYFTVTILGGLLFSIILVNDVVDGLFENKVKDNPNYKTQKTIILTLIVVILAVWFFLILNQDRNVLKILN